MNHGQEQRSPGAYRESDSTVALSLRPLEPKLALRNALALARFASAPKLLSPSRPNRRDDFSNQAST